LKNFYNGGVLAALKSAMRRIGGFVRIPHRLGLSILSFRQNYRQKSLTGNFARDKIGCFVVTNT